MKTIRFNMMVLLCLVFLASCTKEEEFVEAVTNEEENTPPPNEEVGNVGELTDTPCDFTLDNVTSNSTVVIDCQMDLEGKTVNLPADVNFEFEGGEIINGTLNFSGGIIDGRLLNYQLTIEGNATLKSTTFFFDPSRWDIVQGETTSEVALSNNKKLEDLINLSKKMGATTFEMDDFDAYFEISKVTSTTSNQNFYPSVEAINVPSDFNLKMSENTHLRAYPNGVERYALLAVRNESNVTISGGNLHGERDKHDYSSGGPHAWGHVLELHGAVGVTVSNVAMSMGAGDGLKIHSLNHNYEANYIPSNDIVVTDCTFDSNRRNNVSITDGYNIIIENSTFLNAGIDTPNSTGVAPRFALDIEAYRTRDSNGEFIFYEKVSDVIIRNNTEEGSVKGGFLVAIGDNVTIENNKVSSGIGYLLATGVKIQNNEITGNGTGNAITGGRSDTETTYNNEISGNVIRGFGTGITLYSKETKIYDNEIINAQNGIFIPNKVNDMEIYNNTITSDLSGSHGVFAHIASADDVTIYNNEIDTDGYGISFVNVNLDTSDANNQVFVRDNNIISDLGVQVSNSQGIIVED
ncbi:right-handed parallel beta-helix repeat-containing protein [Galbibacter sp. EGI 63066]|uniref:right-handed parallel beta-helix repeat-containing protein n=1 Tax=Galbibacter sp. EGI 63066 TaxID=2993559 RepID=UPI0022498AFB|nr:right-handed parallel beta-helix repeat-containing protein [Galbibacter sp. EGI 63066]MCX2679169.1 right-handed parallel beta-helix repeat-containing protein [Galbibacter sp. EGI 63066]